MSYIAYLCYPYSYEDDDEPDIKFEEPTGLMYKKIIPIQFSVLHHWGDKDKGLYE